MTDTVILKECNFLTLYRPVGQAEMDLIAESDHRRFPPRLPTQPIFYPVLDESYAVQIARDWNVKDVNSGHVGYVTLFRVARPYADQFPVRVVGASHHRELWIPAERLDEFNSHILGRIEIVATFRR